MSTPDQEIEDIYREAREQTEAGKVIRMSNLKEKAQQQVEVRRLQLERDEKQAREMQESGAMKDKKIDQELELREYRPINTDESLAAIASPWLNGYIDFSRRWAPEAYDGFHEAGGLWVLSTIAARRVKILNGRKGRYTPLYICLCARSTLWTKSYATDIARDTVVAAGLEHLLSPTNASPQGLHQYMTLKVPEGYEDMSREERDLEAQRLAFAAQMGWCFDEFGDLIQGISRKDGWQAPFRSMLRRIYNCPDNDPGLTIGRGFQKAIKPYLAILANLTPADLRPHAQKGSQLWHDGFIARWSFVFPEGEITTKTLTDENEGEPIPLALSKPLQEWHQRLGLPSVEIEAILDKKTDKPTGRYKARMISPLPETSYKLSHQAKEAFRSYRDQLRMLASQGDEEDLDASYGRFAETALSIAALLASVEDTKMKRTISIEHWQRGQQIAERWRASLHRMAQNLEYGAGATSKEEKIISLLKRVGDLTGRQIVRSLRKSIPPSEINTKLEALVKLGMVLKIPSGSTHVYRIDRAA